MLQAFQLPDDDEVWGDEITRIYDTFLREPLTAPQQKEKL